MFIVTVTVPREGFDSFFPVTKLSPSTLFSATRCDSFEKRHYLTVELEVQEVSEVSEILAIISQGLVPEMSLVGVRSTDDVPASKPLFPPFGQIPNPVVDPTVNYPLYTVPFTVPVPNTGTPQTIPFNVPAVEPSIPLPWKVTCTSTPH